MYLLNRLSFVFTPLRFSLSGNFSSYFAFLLSWWTEFLCNGNFSFIFEQKFCFNTFPCDFFFISFSFNQSFVGQPRRALRLRHECLNSIHFMRRFNSIIKYFAQFVLAGILFSLSQSDVGFHFILSCTHFHIFLIIQFNNFKKQIR